MAIAKYPFFRKKPFFNMAIQSARWLFNELKDTSNKENSNIILVYYENKRPL